MIDVFVSFKPLFVDDIRLWCPKPCWYNPDAFEKGIDCHQNGSWFSKCSDKSLVKGTKSKTLQNIVVETPKKKMCWSNLYIRLIPRSKSWWSSCVHCLPMSCQTPCSWWNAHSYLTKLPSSPQLPTLNPIHFQISHLGSGKLTWRPWQSSGLEDWAIHSKWHKFSGSTS